MELFATLTLDTKQYDDALKDKGQSASKWGEGLKKVGKAAAAGITAAAAGIGALTKSAVSAYADYEQLVGGVDKLFGEASGKLQQYAAEAYKTSGMSANQYMEQATSFSAALINSLGDVNAAADMTDVAMRAISDNVNTFGSDMGSVQMAFQGFAKQNYTMLDNLKLGYGGTKTEMERLIDDANEYAASIGEASDLSIDSFADVIQAIELIQEKQGVAGTTAKEAAKTISGSLEMTKAAWQNLMAGFANPDADIGKLIDNMVESAGTAAKNLLPAISNALSGIGKVVTELAPIISEQLPGLVSSLAPSLLDSAAQMILALADGLIASLPELIPVVIDVVLKIVDTLIENVDMLVDAAGQIIIALAGGLITALPKLLAKAPEIIASLVQSIIGVAGQMTVAAAQIIVQLAQGIAAKFSTIMQKGRELVDQIKSGISAKFSEVVSKGREIVEQVKSGVVGAVGSLADAGMNLVRGIWNGISGGLGWIKGMISGWVGDVVGFIKGLFGIHSPSSVMRDEVGVFLAKGIGVGFEKEMANVEKMMRESMPDLSADVKLSGQYDTSGYIADSAFPYGNGGVTINVYGAKGQDVDALADKVMRKIYQATNRKVAFA